MNCDNIDSKLKKTLYYEYEDEGNIEYYKVYHNKETKNIKQLKKQIDKSNIYKWSYISHNSKYAHCILILINT